MRAAFAARMSVVPSVCHIVSHAYTVQDIEISALREVSPPVDSQHLINNQDISETGRDSTLSSYHRRSQDFVAGALFRHKS